MIRQAVQRTFTTSMSNGSLPPSTSLHYTSVGVVPRDVGRDLPSALVTFGFSRSIFSPNIRAIFMLQIVFTISGFVAFFPGYFKVTSVPQFPVALNGVEFTLWHYSSCLFTHERDKQCQDNWMPHVCGESLYQKKRVLVCLRVGRGQRNFEF